MEGFGNPIETSSWFKTVLEMNENPMMISRMIKMVDFYKKLKLEEKCKTFLRLDKLSQTAWVGNIAQLGCEISTHYPQPFDSSLYK